MSITFDLPADIEKDLQRQLGDLSKAAREAFIVENYRSGRISLGSVADLLGLETSIQAQQWLGIRGVALNYSFDDLADDRRTLGRVLGTDHWCER